MDEQELIKKLKESGHHRVKVAITDMDGVLRGKYMHRDKLVSALQNGFGFCSVVFGWDMADASYENGVIMTGWHTGYPDVGATIDPNTFRTLPWEDTTPFVLADFSKKEGEGLPICPRNLLKKIISKAAEMGYAPLFSQEFEWFNYRENSVGLHEKNFQRTTPLTPGMFGYSLLRMSENSGFFKDLFELLGDFAVPLEGLHTETGPGATEAAIQYSPLPEAADRAVLFKTATKEIGHRHGIVPSFMAKQRADLPGCGGHIHQSLWNKEITKNLFYSSTDPNGMSNLMKSYVAGQLACLPEILPLFAPTINSYKRLVEGAWAPTTLTWGMDNRTTAIRILAGGEKSSRIEHRVVGADVNPYLAMCAALASGLYGISEGLKLEVPPTPGNGYRNYENGVLPSNLWEASQKMKHSEIAKALFGETFVDHFTKTREWEWKKFNEAVTDWETKRYFEII